ncbi:MULTISPECIES: histidine kinase [Aerococcus]|uniref:histidine kinase n=1 Tax=Aerococcus TaxID=1375 RepID=UPI000DCEC211|nr:MULTISPECIES: histidine kinase [Aerococcus]KAA9298024.1 histidine kinase [Aerococcus tenax]MDK6689640.1 histidine kinase [Aerococcus urinae]MDK8133342.1 histidine kinase [Aerococcus urinae]MDK8484857.1 histidine kinase [Aerococcus urinae]MDL5177712.1 histidine kinase [Aerococcus tenax]
MEDVNKLTDEEVGAIIQARYNAESLQPETEEDRKIVEQRLKKVEEYRKKYLRNQH